MVDLSLCWSRWASYTIAAICLLWMANTAYAGEADLAANQSINCLAANIYHEARGEPIRGQVAVANVVLNRVGSKSWPDTICGVVWQKAQFSWTLDPQPTQEGAQLRTATLIATAAVHGKLVNVVGKANHYHATSIKPPYWTSGMKFLGQIGNHLFYQDVGFTI